MPPKGALLTAALALVVAACAEAPSPDSSTVAPPPTVAATPPEASQPSGAGEVPALAGTVLEGIEPADAPAPSPDVTTAPGDVAFQDVVAVAGLVDACDLTTQTLDYSLPDPGELDELIAAAEGDPVLSSILWAGSLESLASALAAERLLLDESGDTAWIVYDVDGLPRTASAVRLDSASGVEVWAVGLEVTAALPCD